MLGRLLNLLLGRPRRSPRWPAARRAHLLREPACAACGGTRRLQVHHVVPVHVDRGLELVAANLVTLCEAPGRSCHHVWGHLLSWEAFNPDVRADAAAYRRKVEARPQAPAVTQHDVS